MPRACGTITLQFGECRKAKGSEAEGEEQSG